jgi:hypothetical protein
LRPDQVLDGVEAVAEIVAEWGTTQYTAREIGKMIGYTEEFVQGVLDDLVNE